MRREPPLPKELWDRIPPESQAVLWLVVERYEQRIAALEAQVAALQAQLQQNSQNSLAPAVVGRAAGQAQTALPALGAQAGRPARASIRPTGAGACGGGAGSHCLQADVLPPLWRRVARQGSPAPASPGA